MTLYDKKYPTLFFLVYVIMNDYIAPEIKIYCAAFVSVVYNHLNFLVFELIKKSIVKEVEMSIDMYLLHVLVTQLEAN